MSAAKTLLFPFSIVSPYFEGYAWAVELAIRMGAKLRLFTTLSGSTVKRPKDSIYYSLLEAHGYYLQHCHHLGAQSHEVLQEPCIVEGEMGKELLTHLRNYPVDVIIMDPGFYLALATEVSQIVNTSGGAIILSPHPNDRLARQTPFEFDFYDQLRRARCYKLPDNFFDALSQDHTAFNYMRKFFQKNQF